MVIDNVKYIIMQLQRKRGLASVGTKKDGSVSVGTEKEG